MKKIMKTIKQYYDLEKLDEDTLAYITGYENNGEYRLMPDKVMKTLPIDLRWDCSIHATYRALLLLLKYYREGHSEVFGQLKRCLRKSLESGLLYEGFMGELSTIDLLKEMIDIGIVDVLDNEERMLFDGIIDAFRCLLNNETEKDAILELLKKWDSDLMFTYGTLMKGQRNHFYLSESTCLGDSVLRNYGLMEIGSFPGAVAREGMWVTGELYRVSSEEKQQIDYLEGSLYVYRRVLVEMNGKKYYPGFYEYDSEGNGEYPFRPPYGKWSSGGFDPDKYIAYAVYGSNLSDEGMRRYLNNYQPLDSRPYFICHPVYFGNNSAKWDNGGVAFIDGERKAKSYGWIYVVERRVFDYIKKCEGPVWYDEELVLGTDRYGVKIITLTHSCRYRETDPSPDYLSAIGYGLQRRYGLSRDEISEYLGHETEIVSKRELLQILYKHTR
ncbi:MAG: gamma-glutamylcyclotransferase [Erysipelotrichaceae bacterium]|nr:gamma-glutamylcyclotransferase [Erysipelotrichaceae bacterium]